MPHLRLRPFGGILLLVIGGLASACLAQFPNPAPVGRTSTPFHPDASEAAKRLLRDAAGHASEGRWSEAIELYHRVVHEFGDTVTQVSKTDPAADPQGTAILYVDARQTGHRQIASLPAEALRLYRRRFDPEAERWFRAGVEHRDRASLRKVVDEAYCSSVGDDALDLLGDLEFQQGHFAEAIGYYRQLLPAPNQANEDLVYPDPGIDQAQVAAKILLARAALGTSPPTAAEVVEYARQYPDAKGAFAGRSGSLKENLATALTSDRLAVPAPAADRWPTFAGAPSRTRVAPSAIDVGSIQWKARLEAVSPQRQMGGPTFFAGRPMTPTFTQRADRGLSYHPIVLGDQVVLCDAERIFAYNLGDRPTSGPSLAAEGSDPKLAWSQELPGAGGGGANMGGPGRMPMFNVPRFTVTGLGDRIYARLGPSGGMRMGASYVVAVDRNADGKLLWRRPSSDMVLTRRQGGAGRPAMFEGTPVADSRGVYVALTEAGTMATMTPMYVACLDAETGATRWVRFLGEASVPVDAMMGMPFGEDVGNRLLTLDGGTIYYQSNLGAVTAIDAETGSIRWLTTYPHASNGRVADSRDLNPAIVYEHLVIVAPDDTTDLFAFDRATGRLAWRTSLRDGEISHLLGVAQGRLIATGNRVWSFDVETGHLLRYWPEGGTGFQGYGRGLLAGRYIYWPTKSEILVLDQATGLKAEDRESIPLQQAFGVNGGNLAIGDGYLIVAGEDSLAVFCQNSRLIHRYRESIALAPEEASNYIRLALVAEAVGEDELALENLVAGLEKARPAETLDGQPLAEMARARQYRLLMRLATKADQARDWATSIQRLDTAATAALIDRDRLAARLLLADVLDRKGDPRGSVKQLQELLANERLRGLTVAADERRTVRADLLIADRLAGLLAAHGREIYAPYEEQARALLDQGRAESNPRLLEEVARSYPAAVVVPEALLILGTLQIEQKHPSDATRAFRRLLTVAADDATRARAWIGLARAYETQDYQIPAREAYVIAQTRFGDIRLDETNKTVGSLVSERLARPPFAALSIDPLEPSLPLPLARVWSAQWAAPARPLVAEGVPPSTTSSRIFLAGPTSLRAIDPTAGRDRWSIELGREPTWVGYQADHVLAATSMRLVAIDARSGTPRWSFDANDPRPARRHPNPFATPAPRTEAKPDDPKVDGAAAAAPARLGDFRIIGGRIFCHRGDRELLALDGETGQIDWSFTPAGQGTIHARYLAGPSQLILQVREPNAIVVLDTATGSRRAEYPQDKGAAVWARDPLPLDDDHIAMVTGMNTVTMFDLQNGVSAWTYREPSVLPQSGSPRLLGDSGRLLVLRDGSELVRLDPTSGRKLWSRLLGIEDLSEWPNALLIDSDRVYCATGPSIAAYQIADGKPIWRRYLTGPRTGWSLALADQYLVAYPSPGHDVDDALDGLPVVLCRRDSGQLTQRLQLSASVTALAVRLAPGGLLVATQDRGWALGPAGPAVDAASTNR